MPSRYETLNVPKEYDRRRKLTDEQKEQIIKEYTEENISMRQLARKYHVSRTLIKITVDPENKAKRAAYSREYLKAHPISKEKRNEYARNHRHYKKELYETGKINEEGEKNE